jgi:serine/threonine protein kinase
MSSVPVRDAVPPPLPPGTRLASDYRVLGCLTRGRTAEVYDVWSEGRDSRCVAKVLRPERRHDPKAQSALLREGLLLGQLSHPHIVRLYEILWQPWPALILETLTGATLSHLIKKNRRLRLADLAPLGIHVCSAMHYLHHRAGFLHLDLKPSNIVCEGGRAKVIDFSIARRPGPGHKGAGTLHYLAPEQARGDSVAPATDVWGIGVVLFEAATGRKAFPAAGTNGDYAQLRRRAKSVRTYCRLPLRLATAIDGCLEPDPKDRPQVAELSEILSRFA